MNCPACKGTALVMSERQGIEIDYCPQCRGIWLDRGELDKIIARGRAEYSREDEAQRPVHDDRYRGKHYRRKRFWEELFD